VPPFQATLPTNKLRYQVTGSKKKNRARNRCVAEQVLWRDTSPALTRIATATGGYRQKKQSTGLFFKAQLVHKKIVVNQRFLKASLQVGGRFFVEIFKVLNFNIFHDFSLFFIYFHIFS
jgi:hypothetical protein